MLDCDIGPEVQGTHSSNGKALGWSPQAHLRRTRSMWLNHIRNRRLYHTVENGVPFEAALDVRSELNFKWL